MLAPGVFAPPARRWGGGVARCSDDFLEFYVISNDHV